MKRKSYTKQEITKTVRFWQRQLNLSEWTINVHIDHASGGDFANCTASPQYLTADVVFNPQRITSEKLLRQTVVHELLHVALSPLTEAGQALAGESGAKVLDMLEEHVVTRLERARAWEFVALRIDC